ncbi:zinc ribbon domain-containing protein [uncultured Bacteroides sp.]|uniref:zinc ribbon domain-containing protein n=1 Tax=uncultured Bacteroides sp. TaxID=162156 RepID=UPI003424DC97
MMSKDSIFPFLKDNLINFLTRPFLLDTNDIINMFCKYCGKEISDESIYCQFCGKKLMGSSNLLLIRRISLLLHDFKLSEKNKIIFLYYSIWLVINMILLLIEPKSLKANLWFFPFESLELDDYDKSEFIIYSFLLPCLIFCICKIVSLKNKRT